MLEVEPAFASEERDDARSDLTSGRGGDFSFEVGAADDKDTTDLVSSTALAAFSAGALELVSFLTSLGWGVDGGGGLDADCALTSDTIEAMGTFLRFTSATAGVGAEGGTEAKDVSWTDASGNDPSADRGLSRERATSLTPSCDSSRFAILRSMAADKSDAC
jgi:hypothetical protein